MKAVDNLFTYLVKALCFYIYLCYTYTAYLLLMPQIMRAIFAAHVLLTSCYICALLVLLYTLYMYNLYVCMRICVYICMYVCM